MPAPQANHGMDISHPGVSGLPMSGHCPPPGGANARVSGDHIGPNSNPIDPMGHQ